VRTPSGEKEISHTRRELAKEEENKKGETTFQMGEIQGKKGKKRQNQKLNTADRMWENRQMCTNRKPGNIAKKKMGGAGRKKKESPMEISHGVKGKKSTRNRRTA